MFIIQIKWIIEYLLYSNNWKESKVYFFICIIMLNMGMDDTTQ